MPRNKHSMNLSAIVSLLIETFSPSLRQKYLFANFEQSDENRRYKDHITSYLHNRPKEVILHCLDRKTSSIQFTLEDVTVLDDEKGIFKVTSSTKKQDSYSINFSIPSCSCQDWIEHQYPCKHFFATFRLYSKWNWAALPKEYLSTPRMSLNAEALNDYFQSESLPLDLSCDMSTVSVSDDVIPKSKVNTSSFL